MAAVVLLVTLLLVFLLPNDTIQLDPPPSLPRNDAPMGAYSKAAVVTNGYLCAGIGKDVMVDGGNAVDAAIATLLCEGVMNLQSMGIGGGFLMTIYIKDKNRAIALNARETAPAAANKDMYHGDPNLSAKGPLSIAVPGELRGYQEAFEKFGSGKVSWERLFLPTIELCERGYKVTQYVANILNGRVNDILANPGLREMLINLITGRVYQAGEVLKLPKLAATFRILSGPQRANAMYNGSLTDTLVAEIREAGGILTREDFENYNVQWQAPVTAVFKSHTMYSSPLPGSGVVVAFILNLLEKLLPSNDEVTDIQRIIESFKFGYGRRTELGDFSEAHYVPDAIYLEALVKNLTSPQYATEIIKLISDTSTSSDPEYYGAVLSQPLDHGTAHINVIGPNGDAVSATSTINLILGSYFVSPKTGIIWNDEMDDFSSPNITNAFGLPPSPANFIFPGKRPLSSMCPSIFVDKSGDVSLLAGAAGGSTITTTTALMAIQNLFYRKNIKETLDSARVHHQLFPMQVEIEDSMSTDIVKGLKRIGHVTNVKPAIGSTATGIARLGGFVTAGYDYRRGGSTSGF